LVTLTEAIYMVDSWLLWRPLATSGTMYSLCCKPETMMIVMMHQCTLTHTALHSCSLNVSIIKHY